MEKGGVVLLLIREFKILEKLYLEKGFHTTTQLASDLNVTSRTIKNDIKQLNISLKSKGCKIETKSGVGIRLIYDQTGEEFLKDYFENYIKYSEDNRTMEVALMLLRNFDFISMEQLSNYLFVSKTTVLNDIETLIPFF